MDIGSALESVRPWASTGALLTLCEFARRLWLQSRKMRLEENKDDRDGYGVLIKTMQDAIASMEKKHSDEIATLRKMHSESLERIEVEHRRCEERLSKIEGELMGFHRQALVQSQSGVAALPASAIVQAAGERAVAAARAAEARQPLYPSDEKDV